jgi:hypothetical protein
VQLKVQLICTASLMNSSSSSVDANDADDANSEGEAALKSRASSNYSKEEEEDSGGFG